jgi:hypothetical protein
VPKWHEAASATKWYREAGYSPYRYHYKGAAYDKHSSYDPERRAFNAAQEPAYYQEVFPLSELAPKCNKWGQLSKLESACWNKRFRPKPRSMLVGVTLTMNDYYTCPKHAAELDPLICYVSGAVDELLERTDLPVKVKAAPVECKVSSFGWWVLGGCVAGCWRQAGQARARVRASQLSLTPAPSYCCCCCCCCRRTRVQSDMFHNTTIKFVAKVHALKLHSPDSKQQAKASLAHRVMDRLDVFGLCSDYQHGAACEEHGVYEWDAEQLYKLPKGVRWTKPGCLAAQKARHAQELEGYEHYAINWLHDDDVELPAYEDWYAQQQPQQQQPGGGESYEALEQGQAYEQPYAGHQAQHQAQPGGTRGKQQYSAWQQEPSYQQAPPVHQQPLPVYEQPPPVYQQPAPVYQQSQPVYEQPLPVYQQPAPVHQQSRPVYEQPLPVYPQPAPVYQQSRPVYEQPLPVYPQPAPVYQQPPVLYRPAKPQPHGSYGSQPTYGSGGDAMQAYTPPQPTGSVWKKPPPEQHPPIPYAQQQHLLQQPVTMLQAHQQQPPPPYQAYPARVQQQQQQQQQQKHAAAAASSLPHSSSRSGAVHNSRQGISQQPMVQAHQQHQQQQQQHQQHQAHPVGGGISGLLAGALYSLADTLNSQA